jgi:flagellar basal-body rod modification protein FlgD
MSVQPTTSVGQLMTQPAAAATAGRSELGREDFLQLLVAQLRYQDPLNPADGTEFVAQTAQLTSVENLEQLSDLAERSLTMQQQWSAASLVGRTVTVPGVDGSPASGTVTSVLLDGADPVLRVRVSAGDVRDVPLGAVASVAETPPASTTPGTS